MEFVADWEFIRNPQPEPGFRSSSYGLQGFSRELQAVGGATLQSWLGHATANRWIGFLVGAAGTAVVQITAYGLDLWRI